VSRPGDIGATDTTVTEHAACYRALRKFFQTRYVMAAFPAHSQI
jgi:hypothetical protein